MSQEPVITQDNFDKTLAWLNEDREAAGKKYEQIRRTLVNTFIWRGCSDAEDLADEVLNRVMEKIEGLSRSYLGDPALYFYGVAKKLLLERQRDQKLWSALPEIAINETYLRQQQEHLERIYECLALCIKKLKPADGELIVAYYSGDKQQKIDKRRGLAGRLGLEKSALRVRVHRIRATLEKCITRCLEAAV